MIQYGTWKDSGALLLLQYFNHKKVMSSLWSIKQI